jgi:hypothetical protein
MYGPGLFIRLLANEEHDAVDVGVDGSKSYKYTSPHFWGVITWRGN